MPDEHVTLRVEGNALVAIRAEGELPEVLTRSFQGDELLPSGAGPELNGFIAVPAPASCGDGRGSRPDHTHPFDARRAPAARQVPR